MFLWGQARLRQFTIFSGTTNAASISKNGTQNGIGSVPLYQYVCREIKRTNLKGLSHEIDFKTFDKNLQNLA